MSISRLYIPKIVICSGKVLEDLACGKIHVMEVQIRTMVPALGNRWFEMHAVPYGRNEDGKIRKLIGLQSGK